MTEAPKPREWWIDSNMAVDQEDEDSIYAGDALTRHPGQGELSWQAGLIHVIEHSAYLAEKEARERAEAALFTYKNEIEIAPGVFQIKDPEKIGAFLQKRIDALSSEGIELVRMLSKLKAERQVLVDALKNIRNANGSPFDEDFITTEAREALRKVNE